MKTSFRFLRWLHLPSASISRRLLAVILIMSSIITTVITAAELAFDYFQDVGKVENSLNLVGTAYLESVESSLWELHHHQLKTALAGIVSIPGVKYAAIESPQSGIFLEAGSKPEGKTLSRQFTLRHAKTPGEMFELGTLSVSSDLADVLQRLYNRVLVIFLAQMLKTLIIIFAMYIAIQRILTRHLIHITDYLKKIGLKNDDSILKLHRKKETDEKDELDVMADSINEMRSNLHRSYDALASLNEELEDKVNQKTRTILEQRQKLAYAAKMRSLGEMAGGIAHEINSPLTIIGMSNEVMMRSLRLPEVDRDAVLKSGKLVEKTVHRIADIVQSLLKFARDGSRDPLKPTPVREILRDTLYLCQQKLNNTRVELRTQEVPEDWIIPCRPVEISQVILNLLINAFDAARDCPENGWSWTSINLKTNW